MGYRSVGRSKGERVGKHLGVDIAQVLVGEGREQVEGTRHLAALVGCGEEGVDGAPVTFGLDHEGAGSVAPAGGLVAHTLHEGGAVGGADGVFDGKAAVVVGSLGWGDGGYLCILLGGSDVDVGAVALANLMAEGNGDHRLAAKAHAAVAIGRAVGGYDEHIAVACRERHLTLGVGGLDGDGEELTIIIYAVFHARALDSAALGVGDPDGERGGWGVVAYHVDFGVVGCAAHHLLWPVVAAKHLGVHQHAAAGWGIEPAQVEYRFGLAGTKEIPATVDPGFDPGMIVVGMCPSRSIDLARGDAHRAQGCHQERGLFATTAPGGAHRGKRRRRTCIGRLIVGLLMTPVVDFEHGVVEPAASNAWKKFALEHKTGGIEVLVVDTDRQNEVAEDLVGHLPTHLGAHIERGAHLVEEEVAVVVGYVVDGHVGVEETHGVALTVGHRPAEDVEKMSMGKHRLAGIEVGESL